jgi:hypothetical protein
MESEPPMNVAFAPTVAATVADGAWQSAALRRAARLSADGGADPAAAVAAWRRVWSLGPGDAEAREALDLLLPPQTAVGASPSGGLHALAEHGQRSELVDPHGLGAHLWLLQSVDIPLPFGGN